jgi:glycosyltransferase involved in cell wall biosynthesis
MAARASTSDDRTDRRRHIVRRTAANPVASADVAHIVVLNNADLGTRREQVANGELPDQELLGINYFEQSGHDVTLVPFARSRSRQLANRALRRSPIPLGDLDQQWSVLRVARQADLVYAPCQNVAQTLGYLRAVGIFRRPIVWIVHSPLDCGRLRRWRRPVLRGLLRGLDAYPALSGPVADELGVIGGEPHRTGVVRWGPDPRFYRPAPDVGRGVVAAGRTKRDFETFARGAAQTDVPTWIVCPDSERPTSRVGAHTVVLSRPGGDALSYRELLALYAKARAIAIPLKWQWPWTMNGLTSLADALGSGKPVIVTRNPLLEIDVERLGIGICVETGDADGWRDAIRHLDEHPDLALEMGRRARALVDTAGYSSAAFGAQVLEIFERVLQ